MKTHHFVIAVFMTLLYSFITTNCLSCLIKLAIISQGIANTCLNNQFIEQENTASKNEANTGTI